MNRVLVISLEKRFRGEEEEIKKITSKILKILEKDNILVEIYLADNKKMRFLNKKFRGKNKITTVLSFEEPRNFILPPSKFKRLGEIYLNLETKDKQEKIKLLVHGLLHLFGYNHKKESDRIKMEKKEKYVYHCFRFRNIAN